MSVENYVGNPKLSRNMVYVLSWDLNRVGGGETSTRNLLSFGANNAPPVQWTVISPYELPEELDATAVVANEMNRIPLTLQDIPTIPELRKIRNVLADIDPELIIFHHPFMYETAILMSLPGRLVTRSAALWRGDVTTDIGVDEYSGAEWFYRKFKREGTRFVQRQVGNRVTVNLAVSGAVADSLVSIGVDEEKVKVIPEQVGGEFDPSMRLSTGIRKEFLEDDELGVLVVSRLSPEKGLEWMIDVFGQLRRNRRFPHPDAPYRKIKVAVAGGVGEQHPNYGELLVGKAQKVVGGTRDYMAADSVVLEFLGEQDSNQLQRLYNGYDVLLMPSASEGFGRVVVEAMSGGMPVIGRQECNAVLEIIDSAPTTVGITVDSAEMAAGEILRMCHNPGLLGEWSTNAWKWASREYSLEKAELIFWTALANIL